MLSEKAKDLHPIILNVPLMCIPSGFQLLEPTLKRVAFALQILDLLFELLDYNVVVCTLSWQHM